VRADVAQDYVHCHVAKHDVLLENRWLRIHVMRKWHVLRRCLFWRKTGKSRKAVRLNTQLSPFSNVPPRILQLSPDTLFLYSMSYFSRHIPQA
jgi:hypothetical protein